MFDVYVRLVLHFQLQVHDVHKAYHLDVHDRNMCETALQAV